jgi:UDP-2,4-diacetamido-2,4,6-trideoxy-beta-L-altropyranose hydrolase
MKLLIRADAGTDQGTGHVMRCLALAQGWQERGGQVLFLTATDNNVLLERLAKEGCQVRQVQADHNLAQTLAVTEAEKPDWVVLDGYHFTPGHQQDIRKLGVRLLVIDDCAHLEHYHADLVLNQNFGADHLTYRADPHTRFLLGPTYALLRREFHGRQPLPKEIPALAQKLLITLGGSDPRNHTMSVFQAINSIELPLRIILVVGSSNPYSRELHEVVRGSRHKITMLRAVEDMSALMAWAEVAVASGGATLWELLYLGVPALLVSIAENQEPAVISLEGLGFPTIRDMAAVEPEVVAAALLQLCSDPARRRCLSKNGRKIVDGRGGYRVLQVMSASPCRVLFLGGIGAKELARWLELKGEEVFYTEDRIAPDFVREYQPDIIVSYNYRYILKKDILEIPLKGAVNLHISYLPWNKGAHPNVWSFIEDTPKGVTIHYIDEGIDTGDILLQKKVFFVEDKETLKTSYEKLHKKIQDLFKNNWQEIKLGKIRPAKQSGQGTTHSIKESNFYKEIMLEKGWDTPVASLKNLSLRKAGHG